MNRLALFALQLLLFLSSTAGAKRPNILFLFADDWGRCASILRQTEMPGTINDIVETPNFDRIAKQGVFFRNAHVSAPSCTPCRSSLLTGQHFWRTNTGAILQGAVWDASIPSFPLLLQDAGYHIGYTHKVWGPGTPANSPFTNKQSYSKRGGRFNQFSGNVTKMVEQGRKLEEAKRELIAETRGNFEDFLAARPADQPWCYWFGPTNTHRIWIKGSGKALWGIDPDSLKGKMPPYLPDVPEVREDLADYIGEVRAWDAGIGALLEELDQHGETENTLIVISGDHGPPGFPHGKCNLYGFGTGVCLSITGPGVNGGRIVNDFVSLTDLAPTFLAAADLKAPDVMTGRSLWPILQSEKNGLVDASRTHVFTGRERHVENARPDFTPYPQRAIRTADHVLIVNFRPDRFPMGDPYLLDGDKIPPAATLESQTRVTLADMDASPTKAWIVGVKNTPKWKAHYERFFGKRPKNELYDLKKDPHETINLAEDPAYGEVKSALENELMDVLAKTGDPRLVAGGEFFETSPMAGPLKGKAKNQDKSKTGSKTKAEPTAEPKAGKAIKQKSSGTGAPKGRTK
jgi:N-sulfoglucosamine sulfohydrolase